jgi:glycosyltransferase involved in cell wall biosynthesis
VEKIDRSDPSVSIVIRCKNEEQFIGATLEKIFAQDISVSYEVLLIDSGSTDNTLEIARRYPVSIFSIPSESFTFGYALNYGIERAKGSIICLLSAHCMPADDRWLYELISPIIGDNADATYGCQLPIRGINPFEEVSLSRHFPEEGKASGRVPFSNANCAFLKAMWLAVKFDEQLPSWEDYLWYHLLQKEYVFVYTARAAVYHTHRFSLKKTGQRAFRDGRAFRMFKERYHIDLVNDTCPTVLSKFQTAIGNLSVHVRYFQRKGYAKYIPIIPFVILYTYVAYWRGYRLHS